MTRLLTSLAVTCLLGTAACRDFEGELNRCLDGGYCAPERPVDGGVDAGGDAGLDGGADGGFDAGARPCATSDICDELAIDVLGIDLEAVAAVGPNDVWVTGRSEDGTFGYFAQCFASGASCAHLDAGTNEDFVSVAANAGWAVAGGSEGRVIRFDRGSGALSSFGHPLTYASSSVWVAANGTAWSGTQNATVLQLPTSGVPTLESLDGGANGAVNGLWGVGGRPLLALGRSGTGAGARWTWTTGITWARGSDVAEELTDIAGPSGHVYAVGRTGNQAMPAPTFFRVDVAGAGALTAIDAGAPGSLTDVWVSADGGHVFAVGAKVFLHRSPSGAMSFPALPGGGTYDLVDVSGAEPDHLFIVGIPDNNAPGPSKVFHLRFNP